MYAHFQVIRSNVNVTLEKFSHLPELLTALMDFNETLHTYTARDPNTFAPFYIHQVKDQKLQEQLL